MISSPDNDKLKTIRKLQQKRWRVKLGLFCAEGEDLVEAAAAAGWEPEFVLRAGEDVEPELLDAVSALGSGTRVIGVYPQRLGRAERRACSSTCTASRTPGTWARSSAPRTRWRTATVVLGPGCADPFSPKAVRASMGSLFARPPAQAGLDELHGTLVALDASGERTLAEADLTPPVVLCLGAERDGLPAALAADAVRIPVAGRLAERCDGGHDRPLRGRN